MLDLFASAALWVVQMALRILPDSFVTAWLGDLALDLDNLLRGLAYLNWVMDINGMLIVMDLWLLAVASYYAWKFGTNVFDGLRSTIMNVGGWAAGLLGGD